MDFFALKGIIEALLMHVSIFSRCECSDFNEPRLFQEGRAARIQIEHVTFGYFGEASKELEFKTTTCFAELDMDVLVESSNFVKKFQPLSPYPPVLRDLAIITDEGVTWASIEQCITATKVSFLKGINFFDIYRGKQIPEGKKGIAFNLCFQAQDRTLKSDEVDVAQQTILDAMHKNLGAELRRR